MKSLQIYLFLFLSVFALGACIQNDIPYPYIKGEITAFEVEGQTGDAEINKNSRTIVVEAYIPEKPDYGHPAEAPAVPQPDAALRLNAPELRPAQLCGFPSAYI